MIAVYKREIHSLFTNMLIFVYLAIFALFTGLFSAVYNFYGGYISFESILPYMLLVEMISVPILTMRTLAEEKKNKTDLLLASLPIRTHEYVVGKYLSLVTVNLICTLFLCIFPPIISIYCVGSMNFAATYTSILNYFLFVIHKI